MVWCVSVCRCRTRGSSSASRTFVVRRASARRLATSARRSTSCAPTSSLPSPASGTPSTPHSPTASPSTSTPGTRYRRTCQRSVPTKPTKPVLYSIRRCRQQIRIRLLVANVVLFMTNSAFTLLYHLSPSQDKALH